MEKKQSSPTQGTSTSKELLRVTGDGSQKAVIESIFKKPPKREGNGPGTFKIARSPLFDQLQTFLPEFQKSNNHLLSQPQEEIDAMNIECTDDDSKVVEMNLLMHGITSESSDESDTDTKDQMKHGEDSEDDEPIVGPVTAENIKLPNEAKKNTKQGKRLIQILAEGECEKSDSEMTDVSSGSGER